MAFAALSRRNFLRHAPAAVAVAGAAISTAVLAAPVAEAVKPVNTITQEQADAIAAWQLVTIEANAQWEVYCKSSCPSRRTNDAEYVKWQAIYDRQQDAHIEMSRVFYPFPAGEPRDRAAVCP